MQIISLFPLHVVLFPGMPLPLHIFEQRYRLMIQRCLKEDRPFGVVLIRQGMEALGPLVRTHAIGTTARIDQIEKQLDGQMNLIAVGKERFRIRALRHDKPYLTAAVEMLPIHRPHTLNVVRGARELKPWISAYLRLLRSLADEELLFELDLLEMPDDPLSLLYAAAWLLQVPLAEKQPLLEAQTSAHLLHQLRRLYRRELAVTEHLREISAESANMSAWLN